MCVSHWLTLVSDKATHWQKLPSDLGCRSNLLSAADSPGYRRNEFTLQLLFQREWRPVLLRPAACFKEREDESLSNVTENGWLVHKLLRSWQTVSLNKSCFYRKWGQNQARLYNATMLKNKLYSWFPPHLTTLPQADRFLTLIKCSAGNKNKCGYLMI